MLIIENQEYFDKVREFARSVGAEAELQKQLDFLAGFRRRCRQGALSPLQRLRTAQLLLADGTQLA